MSRDSLERWLIQRRPAQGLDAVERTRRGKSGQWTEQGNTSYGKQQRASESVSHAASQRDDNAMSKRNQNSKNRDAVNGIVLSQLQANFKAGHEARVKPLADHSASHVHVEETA